jgi:hypothetical protein
MFFVASQFFESVDLTGLVFLARQAHAGLPDSNVFSNQKSQFWYIWEGLGMENCGIFHLHSVYFVAIWYIYVMAIFYVRLVNFYHFGTLYKRKSGSPARVLQKLLTISIALLYERFCGLKATEGWGGAARLLSERILSDSGRP